MVSNKGEWSTKKKLSKRLHCPNYSQTFTMKTAVCFLCRITVAGCEGHGIFITFVVKLADDSSQSVLTPISGEEKIFLHVGASKDWFRVKMFLEVVEALLLRFGPMPFHVAVEEGVEGRCNA